jgi:hypothetical protein
LSRDTASLPEPGENANHVDVNHRNLEDRSTAAYRMDVDGKLSLLLKSGAGMAAGSFVGFVGRNEVS